MQKAIVQLHLVVWVEELVVLVDGALVVVIVGVPRRWCPPGRPRRRRPPGRHCFLEVLESFVDSEIQLKYKKKEGYRKDPKSLRHILRSRNQDDPFQNVCQKTFARPSGQLNPALLACARSWWQTRDLERFSWEISH